MKTVLRRRARAARATASTGHRLPRRVRRPVPLRVGVTGHIHLTPESRGLVYAALLAALPDLGTRIEGVTCLADGADQLFAEALLAAGHRYDVVLPARDYRRREVAPDNRPAFDRLLLSARTVCHASATSCADAYAAAGALVLDRSDHLLAVWDGSGGQLGGTASVVAAALDRGIPVTVVWPPGARRSGRPSHAGA